MRGELLESSQETAAVARSGPSWRIGGNATNAKSCNRLGTPLRSEHSTTDDWLRKLCCYYALLLMPISTSASWIELDRIAQTKLLCDASNTQNC